MEIIIALLTLIFTAIGTFIAYKQYSKVKNQDKEVTNDEHNKSNRKVLRKLTVAFIIKITKE